MNLFIFLISARNATFERLRVSPMLWETGLYEYVILNQAVNDVGRALVRSSRSFNPDAPVPT